MESVHGDRLKRILRKIQNFMREGKYYEAHQMYRSLYSRYASQRRYSVLQQLLFNAALTFLHIKQYASGTDLGILYINVLDRSLEVPEPVYFQHITNLFEMMNPAYPERETFLQEALRFSTKGTEYKTGHPKLHKRVARVYWKEKNFILAKQHFLNSDDGAGCAAMFVELHKERGYSNEVDLFIAQAVLQYLCLKNKAAAQEAFDAYTMQHPKIVGRPPYSLPLLNFLYFLLRTIETGKLTVFTILCEQYHLSLNRDSCYRQYLDKIGQIYFNIPPARPRHQGLFGSLLQSVFKDMEDDESEEEQRNAASTARTTLELD
ncbi:Golgi to ER traffic protein 4 homolog [Orussus abietinus]|uniref:Golgi to ER traffic protein 4 homolog n=1 Tax=Orussus abietinus TaxID=222816 RepID=UPI000625B807|nr:Golgi to ER traffic protein 4 homolog [Orussus abietinus]